MKLTGVLIHNGKSLRSFGTDCDHLNKDFHDRFEEAFVKLCSELGISVPIWLEKNTKELAMCKKTSFFNDQFHEEFFYDRFELRIDRL